MNAPCLNCKRRTENCHMTCPEYLAYKAENDRRKEKVRLAKLYKSETHLKHGVWDRARRGYYRSGAQLGGIG